MTHIFFPSSQPVAASRLPLTLISLEKWALVIVTGAEHISYLQGQLTVDVTALAYNQHCLAAHCDAKGKMWSNLRLFHHANGIAFIERRSLRDIQLNELKKYAVFSKVTIAPDDKNVLLGVAGFQARAALADIFNTLPDAGSPVVQDDTSTLLWFDLPAERFLLVTTIAIAQILQEKTIIKARMNDSTQWLALDIEAGYPVIDSATSAQFIPQATNLQALNAISFKKGCYTGQEIVARAKFRGANKRSLYWLAGKASEVPKASDVLEMQIGEKWRRTGTILAACRLDNGIVWVQAVLNKDLTTNTILRVHGDKCGHLTIQLLPYKIISG